MKNMLDPNSSPTASTSAAADAGAQEFVVAKVPSGHDARINVRFLPSRDIRLTPIARGCQPRAGGVRKDMEPIALPEGLVGKLKDANKRVIAWLAQDAANAQHFLAHPVEALQKAGVELTRAEQKALDRSHRAAAETRVIAPGMKLGELSASASTSGKVGEARPGAKPKDARDEDCGCGQKGKG